MTLDQYLPICRFGEIPTDSNHQVLEGRLTQQDVIIRQLQIDVTTALEQARMATASALTAATSAAAEAISAPLTSSTQQDDTNVVTFREVISPVSEGTCRRLTRDEIKECYERYSK